MPEELVMSHLARVHIPDDARIAQIRKLVGDRFTDDEIYPWEAEISNDLLDSHFTHMSESTLTNYVEDARAGVAFLRGHNWHELPVGYSVDAELGKEKKRNRVMAGFYTVRGIADTDDLIKRMEAKLLRDVSVGFHGGRAVCDLCGSDFWECRHFPGIKYEEEKKGVVTTKLATFTIEDARLSEVSGVFDGSTPQAMIRKAQLFAADGLLDKKEIEVLEQCYRTRLARRGSFTVASTRGTAKETGKMDEKDFDRIRKAVLDSKIVTQAESENLDDTQLPGVIERMSQRLATLEPQAAEGKQYRTDLIEAAHTEGIRANGTEYDRERYQTMLETASLDTIKRFTADWKKVADKSLPAGRATQDTEEPRKKVSVTPDLAYS